MQVSARAPRTAVRTSLLALRAAILACGLLAFSAGAASALILQRLKVPPRQAVVTTSVAGAAAVNYLAPTDLHAAYSLPNTGAPGQTIAVVSAYDDPTAASDLSKYLSTFHLSACGPAHGCLRKVNQSGQATPLPSQDPTGGTWVTESALGTEIARGVCQSCSILLVEANSASDADFSAAVATAARLGAQVIDTSFASPEQSGDTSAYSSDYTHPGSVVVAAGGDSGYTGGVTFPAAFPNVIAVGGTSLSVNQNGGYGGEKAWSSNVGASGNGCSLYTAAALWQSPVAKAAGCGAKRAVADISAVASPGALVYISNVQGTPGGAWYPAEGTSLSSPVIAGAIGLAGGGGGSSAERLYQRAQTQPGAFHDVTQGSTTGCAGEVICTARHGYDGPTGLGSPSGLGAFLPAGGSVDPRHPFVTVTSARSQIHVSRHWIASLVVHNRNPFTVNATITLRSAARVRVNGHLQTVSFASVRHKLSPLAGATVRLQIANRYRSLLAGLGNIAVTATGTLRGTRGRAVTITARFGLYRP